MEKICLNCSNFVIEENDLMAKQGFAWCTNAPKGHYSSFRKDCDCGRFIENNKAIIDERKAFFENLSWTINV